MQLNTVSDLSHYERYLIEGMSLRGDSSDKIAIPMKLPRSTVREALDERRQPLPAEPPSTASPSQSPHSADSESPVVAACQQIAGQQSGYPNGLPDRLPDRLPDVEQLQQAEAGLSSNPLIRACQKIARESEEAQRLASR